jgi:hypothetical protein
VKMRYHWPGVSVRMLFGPRFLILMDERNGALMWLLL